MRISIGKEKDRLSCHTAKRRLCLLGMIVFLMSGCATARHAVPLNLCDSAQVPGMPNIRAAGGRPSEVFKKDFVSILEQEDFQKRREFSILAISGGAAHGTYGAGLLNGWSQQGTRPVFQVVTGVSVGAILAPFVFLGSDYDGQMKDFCEQSAKKRILRFNLTHDSLASSQPLQRLIAQYFNKDFLQKIAREHKKGRRLYVGTTNLDSQQLIVWDMGKIASYGDDKALELFHEILLASASIPIVFSPVIMHVEANGQIYDEMHVDGGVMKQVFFIFDILYGMDKAMTKKNVDMSKIRYKIYVIRNGYVDPVWKEVPDRITAIGERTVESILNSQSLGDIYQLYTFSKFRNGDFYLASIPGTHVSKAKELFDAKEMKELFDLGYEQAVKGYPWKKSPQGAEF